MFRVHPLRSLLALLLLACAVVILPGAVAQTTPQVCDCDADGDIDKADITLIADARGKAASGPTDPRDPDRDNKITSADARTCTQRCTFPKCGSPTNRPPIADAGPDATVFTDQQVMLDGSDSTDPDGDPLTFRWTFVSKPAGSNATLTGAGTASPKFTPDVDGRYTIQLIVNDGQVDSAPDSVTITTGNAPPVADAGDDQSAVVNASVKLDGTGSSDINGDPLTYSWTFASKPQGSTATLSKPTDAMPTFTPDLPGVYVLRLIVNDGKVNSQPDTVRIETGTRPNERPIADAGDDQTVNLGARVTLDGSGSRDPDNGPSPLTYSWSISTKPAGSAAVLSSRTVVNPTFTADKAGEYVIQLIVNDGADSSAPDTVRITTRNTRPVADAGDDQNRNVGDTVALDGTGSFDADGDSLSYQWSLTSRPAGSTATIANPSAPTTSFVADRPGMYVVQLVVNDGQFDSLPDTATITINTSNLNQISIDDLTVTEGNSGARSVTFTARRANPSGTSTVSFRTANGTATVADNDYAANSGTVTFGAGATTRPVGVSVVGDTRVEPDETFFVNLSNPSANATIADAQATGTITNDDTAALPVVTITATDANASETGPNVGVMRIRRTGSTAAALGFGTTRGGSASNAADYLNISGNFVIPAGAAFIDVTFTPVDDALVEGAETIIVTIDSSPSYTVGTPSSATVTIADNDTAQPTVTIVAIDAAASEAGPNAGVMRVSRTGSTAAQLAVATGANQGTATNNVDYQLVGQILIPAGAAFVDVVFTPIDDTLVEGAETIIRTIIDTSSYIVGTPNSATVTIADNDTAALPTVTIVATDAAASEAGPNVGVMRISRTGSTSAQLTVRTTRTGTAVQGRDFTQNLVGTNFLIPIGATFVDVRFTPIDDADVESAETIIVTLFANAAYTIGTPNTATVTIADNDTAALPTVTMTATDATASEDGPNVGVMRIARSGGNNTLALPIALSTTGSTATGSDFTVLPAGTSIPAGAAFVDITFTPVEDAAVEGPEEIVRTITASPRYDIGTPSRAIVTIEDNDSLPVVTITARDADASEAGPNVGVMRIARSGGNNTLALPIALSTTGSTATGSDFTVLPAGTSIPAGAAFVDITFTPVEDAAVEGPEEIVRTITASPRYDIGTPSRAIVTIEDNDSAPRPTVTVAATDANASEQGQSTGTLTISRSGPTTAALQVVGTFSGAAINGTDYASVNGTVSIPIGQSSVTRTITPIDDTTDESDETVIYELQAGNYIIGAQDSATVTIADNDTTALPTVTLATTDAAAGETSPNPGPGRFTVTRTGPTTGSLIVLLTIGGSATNGSDYQSITAGVTIAAGSATATVDVVPINDSTIENTETVILSVAANAGVYVVGSPSSGQVNIADNDVGRLVQFTSTALSIGQNLQVGVRVGVSAGTAPAGGLALRIVSSSPNVLLSATATGAGAQNLNLPMAGGAVQSETFFVNSLASSGTASLTVEIVTTPNPGFSPGTPASVTMSPAGYELLCQGNTGAGTCTVLSNGHGIGTTAQAAPTLIYIQAQRLNANTTNNRAGNQNVRGGTTINLPLSLSNANLGVFRANNNGTPGSPITQLSIPAGQYYTYFYFDPNNASSGNGTITFTKPTGAGTPLNNSAPYAQSMPVDVTGATPIRFNVPTLTVGRDLEARNFLVLGAAAPSGGLSVRLTSSNANTILSASTTAAGSQTLDITVAAGSLQSPDIWVQSLASSGTANISMQVLTSPNPGFSAGTPLAVTLAPSGYQLFCYQGPGTCTFDTAANRDILTTVNSNPNKSFYIEAYYLNPANPANNIVSTQLVRGGITMTFPLSLTNTSIGALRDYPNATNVISQVSIPGGQYFSYFFFDPNNSSTGGNGVINFTKPATAGTPTAGGTPRRQSASVVVTQ